SIASEFSAIYNYCILALMIIEQSSENEAVVDYTSLSGQNASFRDNFEKAQAQVFELFKKKDHDYNGSWVAMDISDIVDEIIVKLLRANYIMISEKRRDDLTKKLSEIVMDIANYGAFAAILIEEVEVDPMN